MSRWAIVRSLFGRWATVLGSVQFVFGLWSFLAAEAELQATHQLHPARYLPDWPWWGWAISLVCSVLVVVVVNAIRLVNDRDEALSALREATDLPRFRFVDAKGAMLTRRVPASVGTSSDSMPGFAQGVRTQVGRFWALRLRLENRPVVKSARSHATNVAARLRFFGVSATEPVLEFFGRWTVVAAATASPLPTARPDSSSSSGMPRAPQSDWTRCGQSRNPGGRPRLASSRRPGRGHGLWSDGSHTPLIIAASRWRCYGCSTVTSTVTTDRHPTPAV